MQISRLEVCIFTAGMVALGSGSASAQDYPNKPIRIITGAVGGAGDFASRLIAQGISSPLGQQVIVDNRGNIAAEVVAKAPPDGYTLVVDGASFWIGSLLQDTPYNPVRDFSPIAILVTTPNILVVHPSLPAKSVRELIALAKARPGELNYAAGATGGSAHLAAELFKTMAGIEIVRINYKGNGPAVTALVGGETQFMFPNAAAVTPHLKTGRLRALAVTSAQPSALTPGLPTVMATGLPGYESVSPFGMFAPAKTPATFINRLNQEVARVLNRTDVKEKFASAGMETVGSSSDELAVTVRTEMAKWGKLIKDTGIKVE